MKAKINITTWQKNSSQGSVVPIAICEMEVTIQHEQVLNFDGCSSAEIEQRCSVPTVKINGRKFICDKPYGSDDQSIDYRVAIPWQLAESLNVCPHCKAIL
jgi:hypothetical protein